MEELKCKAAPHSQFKMQGQGRSDWGEELRKKMESYNDSKTKTEDKEPSSLSVMFSLEKAVNGLTQVMGVLQDHNITLNHIESRSSVSDPETKEFLMTIQRNQDSDLKLLDVLDQIKQSVKSLEIIQGSKDDVVWFPKTLEEMNPCMTRPLYSELEPSHPGAKDPDYLAHRKNCWEIAQNYKIGTPVPRMEYSENQIKTFGAIFSKLKVLYPTNACKEFNRVFPDLVKECDIREDHIPQMEDISNFVKKRTGFTLRPVSALLSARDFLSALAFRVFPATQYLRHTSSPFYTPEPDLCHELLGHCALLANPEFAQFSQEIGLASLGAPDEYIDKLSSVSETIFRDLAINNIGNVSVNTSSIFPACCLYCTKYSSLYFCVIQMSKLFEYNVFNMGLLCNFRLLVEYLLACSYQVRIFPPKTSLLLKCVKSL